MEEPLAKKSSRKSSAEDASGKKSRKKNTRNTIPGQNRSRSHKVDEADTENIVDFMHEEIKKRPMNRKKLMQRARKRWRLPSCLVSSPAHCLCHSSADLINNIVNPGEKKRQ